MNLILNWTGLYCFFIPVCFSFLSSVPLAAQTVAPSASPKAVIESVSVIPIQRINLTNGGRFFLLPVSVGSKRLFAAVDTGSSGLRVVTRALAPGDYAKDGDHAEISFGSGTTISGFRAKAEVSFGTVRGPLDIQVITGVSCVSSKPRCAEGHLPMQQFGLMGSALPGQGAPAIVGLASSDLPVNLPFPQLGVQRWILDMPNDIEAGKLVLNPTAEMQKGFVRFEYPPGSVGAVPGCLQNDKTHERICGVISFDTGAAGISVSSPQALPASWPAGTPATLQFENSSGDIKLVQHFKTGDPAHSSRLHFDHNPSDERTVIHANFSPYLCFDVMYEADHKAFSLRPRRSGRNDPQASTPSQ